MNKALKLVTGIILAICLAFIPVIQVQPENHGILQLDHLIQKHGLDNSYVGVEVRSMKTGEIVFEKNANKYFVPGSNQKLITTWLGLTQLGPEFTFKTRIYVRSTSNLSTTNLKSGLLIEGSGDPTLTPSKIASEISRSINNGPKTFSGPLLLDESKFDDQYFGSGWMWDDDHNFILPLSFEDLKYTIDSPYDPKIVIEALGQKIESALSEKNIALSGKISEGKVESGWKKVVTLESKPLLQLLNKMNKHSINYYADMIWKTIGHEVGSEGSFQAACEIAKSSLEEIGVDPDLTFVDGSGLSRYNVITPRQLTDLLAHTFSNPKLNGSNAVGYSYNLFSYENDRNLFTSVLPDWGTGTLFSREHDLPVKAKTGTLEDSSTLSGYLKAGEDVLAFSIMVNRVREIEDARRFQDDLLRDLLDLS